MQKIKKTAINRGEQICEGCEGRSSTLWRTVLHNFSSLAFIIVFLLLFAPPTLSLADSLVPCNNTFIEEEGKIVELCDFNALMDLVNIVIHFILYDMIVPIAAIMFAYAGILMITAGGEAGGARTKAKSIFTNVAIGLTIAIAAFLIIRTVLSILGYEGSWIGFDPIPDPVP